MYTHPLHKDPSLESLYNLCEKKAQVTMKFPEVDNLLKLLTLYLVIHNSEYPT